jgi:acetyl-CoA carboxylase biotin carboxyl carrier protein
MSLSDDDIREILRIIDESDLTELEIQTEGFSLHVRKGPPSAAATAPAPPAPAPPAPRPPPGSQSLPVGEPASTQQAPAPTDGLSTITAPMLGTFYRAEAPGKPPFVEVGQQVDPDTIVCIIEVMKMMNSVTAGVSGKIIQISAANAELVEYGQPLFEVGPA